MTEPAILALLLFAGLLSHFLKRVVEERNAGRAVTLKSYWLDHPYHSALSVTAAVAGFILLWGTPELTRLTAWGIGYMADSAAGVLGQRAMKIAGGDEA